MVLKTVGIAEPKFWNSWKGQIIREIVLANVYRKEEIIQRTQLREDQFEQALKELLYYELVEERRKDFYFCQFK